MKNILLITCCLIFSVAQAQKFKDLSMTPPMGWNSWNKFACDVDETLIREVADAIVSSGMKDAGYEYIVIDDCWHGERDSLGFIHASKERFPSGIKALADYVHSKGLKFGIYSDAGWKTCAGKPGSRGHEYQDALSYAKWGVDYLKYDWCNTEGLKAEGSYLTMRDALYAAGRPIVFSICEWGQNKPWEWAGAIGNLWRTTGDISPCFDCLVDHGDWSSKGVMQIVNMQKGIRKYAGPGHWNDPDMMEVGNGMSDNEGRAHFSLWAMLAAPLMSGNDPRDMSKETTAILTNKRVIAVNQDSLGIQGFRYRQDSTLEVWVKPLTDGNVAVCFLNPSTKEQEVNFNWSENIFSDPDFDFVFDPGKENYSLTNLWTGKTEGQAKKILKKTIPGHDVLMYKLTRVKK